MENVVVAKGAFHDKVEDSLFICYWAESNRKEQQILVKLVNSKEDYDFIINKVEEE